MRQPTLLSLLAATGKEYVVALAPPVSLLSMGHLATKQGPFQRSMGNKTNGQTTMKAKTSAAKKEEILPASMENHWLQCIHELGDVPGYHWDKMKNENEKRRLPRPLSHRQKPNPRDIPSSPNPCLRRRSPWAARCRRPSTSGRSCSAPGPPRGSYPWSTPGCAPSSRSACSRGSCPARC